MNLDEHRRLHPTVTRLREAGATWAEIAVELGVTTRQARRLGYSPDPPPLPTRATPVVYPEFAPAAPRRVHDDEPDGDQLDPVEDWLDDHTLDAVLRRVVDRMLHRIGTTRAAVLAWAHPLDDPDPTGPITIDLLERYADEHDHELYPARTALREHLIDAQRAHHRQAWERDGEARLARTRTPAAAVRAWALAEGLIDRRRRGRLPGAVMLAYLEAHPGDGEAP